ncbi:hypothetical protein SAMN05216249_107119 [Acetitomaculum ruminis DSM 5522]|uniref:Uncharacterized protein n=1 Tax=Acetitomaculum ruminis DSM 5522 TaxID=1120918 RepID=A0A1I0XTR9_9FIRM|nr:hypothetical protein [Acetitomaculum ruminis]SFB03836.1 hypothetical protein SAMN05216249_107119 [Acetitomaculum ruminis DSM 5522]
MDYKEIERSINKTYRKKIWSKFIKGIKNYSLIDENDRILSIVSGDLKSDLTAFLLNQLKKYGEKSFELKFLQIDKDLNITLFDEYEKVSLFSGERGFNKEFNGEIKKKIISKAKESGFNKIAIGLNFDDCVKKTLKSMLFEGKIDTYLPDEKEESLRIISPLYLIKDENIYAFTEFNGLSYKKKEKDYLDKLIDKFRIESPFIDSNIFKSVENVNLSTVISYIEDGKKVSFLDNY